MGLASFLGGMIVVKDAASGALLRYNYLGYLSVGTGLVCLYLIGRIRVIDNDASEAVMEA